MLLTRRELDEKLNEIRNMLISMADQVCSMVLDGVEGAVSDDVPMMERVVAADPMIDDLEDRIMREVFELMVMQSPVSDDARLLMGTLSIVGELEQAGDDAVKLARRASKMRGKFREDLLAPLGALAESSVQMMSDAMALYSQYDDEKAKEIIEGDEMIDTAYKRARRHILEVADEEGPLSRDMFRTIEIFHALEHFADHGVEIAKRLRKFHRPVGVLSDG